MSWPNPEPGKQRSWKTNLALALIAFATLVAIGYLNGRSEQILEADVITATPVPERRALGYPSLDLTQNSVPERGTSKETEHSGAQKNVARSQSVPQEAKAYQGAPQGSSGDRSGSAKKTADPSPGELSVALVEYLSGAKAADKVATKDGGKSAQQDVRSGGNNTSASAKASECGVEASGDKAVNKGVSSSEKGEGYPQPSPTTPVLSDPQEAIDAVYDNSWPPPQNRPRTESTFLRRIPSMMLFLGLVCVLIYLTLHFAAPLARRFSGRPSVPKQIEVVERQSLGPNKVVVLVQVSGKRLLLGMTEKSITTLAELPLPEPLPQVTEVDGAQGSVPGEQPDLRQKVLAQHLAALPLMKQP